MVDAVNSTKSAGTGSGTEVSIIVVTFNGEDQLPGLLEAIKNQSIRCDDIWIIDSSSEDNTLSVAVHYGVYTQVIPKNSFNHGGTRNFGASLTKGDILVFFTQDALPVDNKLLEDLTRPFQEDHTISASYARQIPRPGAGPIETFARIYNYPNFSIIKSMDSLLTMGIKTFFISNSCAAYRRSVFEELDGFPENQIMNEDLVFAAKMISAGYKVAYMADAKVYHSHEYTVWKQFCRHFDIGVSLNSQRWVLDMARSEKEGNRFIKEEIMYLWKERNIHLIPYAVLDAGARYLGYKLGLMEAHIPFCLKKKLSMHSQLWDHLG